MIATGYGNSGDAHDFYAWDANGNVWDNRIQILGGQIWTVWVDANFADYRIVAIEQGTTGRYMSAMPPAADRYEMRFRGVDLAGSYIVWEDQVDYLPNLTPGEEEGALPILTNQTPLSEGGPLQHILVTQNILTEVAKYQHRINSLPSNSELFDFENGPGQPFGLPILDADGNWLASAQQTQLDNVETGVDVIEVDTASILAGITSVAATIWSYADRTLTAFGFKVALTDTTEADIDAIKLKTATIGTASATILSPLTQSGEIDEIIQGDDYTGTRSFNWLLPATLYGDLTGATPLFQLVSNCDSLGPITGTIVDANTEQQTVNVPLTGDETAEAAIDQYKWELRLTRADGGRFTPYRGETYVVESLIT